MEEEKLLKAKQMMDLLSLSRTTFYVMVDKGMIPYYKIGEKTLRFKESEVMNSLKRIVK